MSVETPNAAVRRLDSVQILRALAALLVLLSHLWVIESKYSPDQITSSALDFGFSGVDLFFVISGFIMVYVSRDTTRGPGAFGRFLYSRFTRVYPLYWAVSLAVLAVYLWRPEIIVGSGEAKPNILKSALLWPDIPPDGTGTRLPLLTVGWTLVHELSFYIIFAVSMLFSRRFLLPFLLAWSAVFIAGNMMGLASAPNALRIIFDALTAEFLLGAFAGWLFLRIEGRGWGPACGLFIVSAVVFWGLRPLPVDFSENWTRVLNWGLPGVFLLYGLVGIEQRARRNFPRWLAIFGDHSYALYLTHLLALSVMGRIWAIFARDGWVDNLIMLPLMTAVCIAVAAVTYYWIERPLLRLTKSVIAK
ncbi:acyltransferase family protein [Robiginitomaculum antarcticum]|uniref:acyltransferase family protein n=1 Tax=Robiginitomaculum antarcticum TaxID=437507 RepID=UPI00035F2E0D|nr:acyltransferase [Robiginitomaculum antarcticum]